MRIKATLLLVALLMAACGNGDANDATTDSTLAVKALEYSCLFAASEENTAYRCITKQESSLLPSGHDIEFIYEPDELNNLTRDDFRRIMDTLDSDEFIPINDAASQDLLRKRAENLMGVNAEEFNRKFKVAQRPRTCRPGRVWRIPVCR